ncbi:MAG: glycosyltransferase [Candidatus Acidiferrales bacterium]
MKLSVMMITYNHGRYLPEALDSALSQRVNFDYEIVVGEDCSTDGTREILMDYSRKYPGRIVTLLQDQNVGTMRNFEATLASCKGEYVAFLEGDDSWLSANKLQSQVDFLDANPNYAICCARARILNETSQSAPAIYPECPAGTYSIENLLGGNLIATCTAVCRGRAIGVMPRWFHELKMGDWPLFAIAATSGKIHLIDEVLALYRVHPGGIWSALKEIERQKAIIEMLKAVDKHLGYQYAKIVRRTIAGCYCAMANISKEENKRATTAKYLLACVWNRGWVLEGRRRMMASLAAYTLTGSSYKIFSRKRET